LARFGEADEDSPHQCVVRNVVKVLRIAMVRVVLGWFIVTRIIGVAFWVASRRSFIYYFSKEGPTFALASPSCRVRLQAWVLTIFRRFRKAA
jgi:hypothetical protein